MSTWARGTGPVPARGHALTHSHLSGAGRDLSLLEVTSLARCLLLTWRGEAPPARWTFPPAHRTVSLGTAAARGCAGRETLTDPAQALLRKSPPLWGEVQTTAFERQVTFCRGTGMASGQLGLSYGKGTDPIHSSSRPELLALSQVSTAS